MITFLALSPSLDVVYLVTDFTSGEINRPSRVLRSAGGKAINSARAVVALGGSARVVAPLGGNSGASIQSLLTGTAVDLVAVANAGETRSCVSIAAEPDGPLTEIYEPATPVDAAAWAGIERELGRLTPPPGGWLVVSGSVPEGVDLDALVALLRLCRAAGFRIAIDTHDAALVALVAGVHPELVKVNRAEAATLLGLPMDAELGTLAGGIRDRTGGLVVVTDGIAGSLARDANGTLRVTPDSVVGRYAVGSGDCFLGGLLAALDRGDGLADALSLAAACASANALVPGAATFDPDAVRASRDRVTLIS